MGHSEQNAWRNIFPPVLEGILFFFLTLVLSSNVVPRNLHQGRCIPQPCLFESMQRGHSGWSWWQRFAFAPVSSRGAPSLSEVHLQLTPGRSLYLFSFISFFLSLSFFLLFSLSCASNACLMLSVVYLKGHLISRHPLPTTVTHCELLQVQEKLCSQ